MPSHETTIAALLSRTASLASVSDTPRLDLEVLLCHVMQQSRSYLYTWPERVVETLLVRRFEHLLERRMLGEPVAYLVGTKDFWSLSLHVNTSTLIPRPESELLVETALELIDRPEARVLDLGTGTGAIALALASERTRWRILAVDIVAEAVELAKKNCHDLGLMNVSIAQGDWFEHLTDQRFDAIVSNPPYIEANDPHLREGDVRFEPVSALIAERNGLAEIEFIVTNAGQYLTTGGWLLVEHGYQQGHQIRALLVSSGFGHVATRKDGGARERVSLGCWQQ